MNTEQAREVLSSTKGRDREDPLVREALELAEGNPELRKWMEKQEVMDAEISGALNDVSIPDGLEQVLLKTVGEKPRRWNGGLKKTIWTFGVAAMLVIGLSVGVLTTKKGLVEKVQVKLNGESIEDFGTFREGMAFLIAETLYRLDHRDNDLNSIESWLEERAAPVHEDLPESLLALKPIGCKKFEWRGQTVSLVCFHSGKGEIVHLFMMDRAGIPDDAYQGIETIAKNSGLPTGGWITGKRVYLLVGSGPDVDIGFAMG